MKEICKQVLEQAYLFIDGEVLTYSERLEISTHLEECAPCLERFGLEEDVHLLVTRLRGTTLCPEALRQRINSLVEGE